MEYKYVHYGYEKSVDFQFIVDNMLWNHTSISDEQRQDTIPRHSALV